MHKRISAILITIMLALTLLPAVASADGNTPAAPAGNLQTAASVSASVYMEAKDLSGIPINVSRVIPGQEFMVWVRTSPVNQLISEDLSLKYDPGKLEVMDQDPTTSDNIEPIKTTIVADLDCYLLNDTDVSIGKPVIQQPIISLITVNTTDPTGGYAKYMAANQDPADYQSAVLAKVRFKVKAAGVGSGTNITFAKLELRAGAGTASPVIVESRQELLLQDLQGGTVTGKVKLEGRTDFSGINIKVSGTSVSTVTDQAGMFSLQGIAEGNYTLELKKDNYLIKKVNVTVTSGVTIDMATVTLRAGDANNDNKVDLVDLGILASGYRATKGSPGYNINADFNNDGVVDLVDLGFLASNYRVVGD